MTTTQLNLITPLDSPLPLHQNDHTLTESQWTTLLAIADTIVPSVAAGVEGSTTQLAITEAEYAGAKDTISQRRINDDSDLTNHYLDEKPSSIPAFKALLERNLNDYLRADAKKGLRVILSALE